MLHFFLQNGVLASGSLTPYNTLWLESVLHFCTASIATKVTSDDCPVHFKCKRSREIHLAHRAADLHAVPCTSVIVRGALAVVFSFFCGADTIDVSLFCFS